MEDVYKLMPPHLATWVREKQLTTLDELPHLADYRIYQLSLNKHNQDGYRADSRDVAMTVMGIKETTTSLTSMIQTTDTRITKQRDSWTIKVTRKVNKAGKTCRKMKKNQIATVMTKETADTEAEVIHTEGYSVTPAVSTDMYQQGALKGPSVLTEQQKVVSATSLCKEQSKDTQ